MACGKENDSGGRSSSADLVVEDRPEEIFLATGGVEAVIRKRGYVSGVAGGSFLDKRSGYRDAGHGLDIVDWIMEPGSDEEYRDQLPEGMAYEFDNLVHGRRPKRIIEGPQICTRARELSPEAFRGPGFVGARMEYRYHLAAPGKKTGSLWRQTLVFPAGKRYFLSCDQITTVNASPAMFLRIDLPGHIKHRGGDTFSEVYLSYHGRVPAAEFLKDFAPDEKLHYLRERDPLPERFIRAYRLRDPGTGREGPWLAGMTLEPSAVYEAWCHQRGYVSMIQEIGGRPIEPGGSFQAAYVVGFFDSIEEMREVYDRHKGHTGLHVDEEGWELTA